MSQIWPLFVHLTEHDEADASDLQDLRNELNGKTREGDVRLTPIPFIVKTCAATLSDFTKFNSSLDASLNPLIVKK